MSACSAAAYLVNEVVNQKHSLTYILPRQLAKHDKQSDRALIQELCYGTLRFYPRLDYLANQLLNKPLKQRDQIVHAILLVGLYQLIYLSIPTYAVVSTTVEATVEHDKSWAKALVNGILRQFLRRQLELTIQADTDEIAQTSHPSWLLSTLKSAWPTEWSIIISANNNPPPFCLRVNGRQIDREQYLQELIEQGHQAKPIPYTSHGIELSKAIAVDSLPGFYRGKVSVQDGAAQLASPLLEAQSGEYILDACAAPGGKTTHLLELVPHLQELVAIDQSQERLNKIDENLKRLQLSATLILADAADSKQWCDGRLFDRILLDVPCSATGIIRRHIDIKLLRQASDLESFTQQQWRLLTHLWPLLKPGGLLLYCTCSILPIENEAILQRFIATHSDASVYPIIADWGQSLGIGRQILPSIGGMDGFYYGRLVKQ